MDGVHNRIYSMQQGIDEGHSPDQAIHRKLSNLYSSFGYKN